MSEESVLRKQWSILVTVLVIDPREHKVVDRFALGEPTFAADGKDAHGLGITPDGSQLWLKRLAVGAVLVEAASPSVQ